MVTICSKCGKIAQGYEGIGYTMIDGALYCPDCTPEIKPEWIRDVRNGSMFYDMEPDMYYTSIEELCKEWGANPDDLKFEGRIKIEILWPNGNSPWDNYIGHYFKKGGKKRAILKPCPFCGNKFIFTMTLTKENRVLVVCQECKAQIRGTYVEGSKEYAEEQIIKDWNRRVNK